MKRLTPEQKAQRAALAQEAIARNAAKDKEFFLSRYPHGHARPSKPGDSAPVGRWVVVDDKRLEDLYPDRKEYREVGEGGTEEGAWMDAARLERFWDERKKTQARDALEQKGLPLPPGDLLNARYSLGGDDWYAETDKGWHWWSGKDWKFLPHGPNPR